MSFSASEHPSIATKPNNKSTFIQDIFGAVSLERVMMDSHKRSPTHGLIAISDQSLQIVEIGRFLTGLRSKELVSVELDRVGQKMDRPIGERMHCTLSVLAP